MSIPRNVRSDWPLMLSSIVVGIAYVYAAISNPVLMILLTGITAVFFVFFTRGEDDVD